MGFNHKTTKSLRHCEKALVRRSPQGEDGTPTKQSRAIRKDSGLPRVLWSLAMTVFMMFLIVGIGRVQAATHDFEYQSFAQIPVLDGGRIKPLDSFARTQLEEFSGRDRIGDREAIEWLATLLITPEEAYETKLFNVAAPVIIDGLGLERRAKHRYSYAEISEAFRARPKLWQPLIERDPNTLTQPQKQVLDLLEKTQNFAALSRSLSLVFEDFTLPEDGVLAARLDKQGGDEVSYLDLRAIQNDINREAKTLLHALEKEGKPLEDADRQFVALAFQMKTFERDGRVSMLRVVPPQWGEVDEEQAGLWFSPWDIGQSGQGSAQSAAYLQSWQDAVRAYRAGDSTSWEKTTATLRAQALGLADQKTLGSRLDLETQFNNLSPFKWSFGLYLAGFVLLLLSFFTKPKWIVSTVWVLILAGFALHFAGLGVRMGLLGRPPVTNLYESIIFVGFIAVLGGFWLEMRLKNALGLLVAAFSGAFLQLMGLKFDAQGDTMGMLIAVLNTNFWLATHVVIITMGYGFTLVAALLGHIYLFKRLRKGSDNNLFKAIRGMALLALLFTALGTILGGIWADQSWGRFWGWDPKENGALLIVLWIIWLLHGRVSQHVGDLGFVFGMALSSIIVALAWFGVNLLAVGLHSYGFTEGLALSLSAFCGSELLLLGTLYIWIKRKEAKS